MAKGYRQLRYMDRIKLEFYLKEGLKKTEIAEKMGVHRSTIYNELKRGQYEHLNSDYTTELRYSPEIAQQRYEENLKMRGTQLKIGNDIKFANYIESKIVDDGYSPDAVLGELKVHGREDEFSVTICTTTLYSYIDKGIFLRLTNKDLPVKGHKKRKYHKVKRQQVRRSAGESIEKRPEDVEDREEFGHWEMDSVIGKRGKSKCTLLTLTERKTRNEIIFKLPDHTAGSVVDALDRLECKWGEQFKEVFKSITVDNGTEFALCEELQRSVYGGERTKVYYCHAYCSWERGTNEVGNRMVRRKVPKGTDFDDMTDEEIQQIEDWMNQYPRKIHNYYSAGELFEIEIRRSC